MSSTKGFLAAFAVVYVILASAGLYLWGPPGNSAEFLAEHKDSYDHYLATTKSTAYKQFIQQGDAAPDDPAMTAQAAFIDEFVASPDFQAETRRRAIYGYYFGFLNAGGLMLIAYRFGRKPITGFLDTQIAEIQVRLERAAAARAEANARLEEAQSRIDGLKIDEAEAQKHAAELMERERILLEEGTQNALAFIDQETEDRKRIVGVQAEKTLRKELIEHATKTIVEDYHAKRNAATETAEIDLFIAGLAGRHVQELMKEGVSK